MSDIPTGPVAEVIAERMNTQELRDAVQALAVVVTGLEQRIVALETPGKSKPKEGKS